MNIEIVSENAIIRAVIEGTAPRPASLAAARGALPIPQADLLEALVFLAKSEDAELAPIALQTLVAQDVLNLRSVAEMAETAPSVLAYLTERKDLPRDTYEILVRHIKTPDSAILKLATNIRDTNLLEVIAGNQQRLIRSPAIIEAILANPSKSAEIERRVQETKKEFFEKERGAQQVAEELRAQGFEAAAEFIETVEITNESDASGSKLTAEDALFLAKHIEVSDSEIDDSWLGLEYLEEIFEETDEQRQALVNKIIGDLKIENDEISADKISLIQRVMKMNMKERVKYAMKGDREARTILIRDPNKIVAQGVINNPRITDQEVEKIAAMRTVPGEVLRLVAMNRTWMRIYGVIHNLARNPRTPLANAMTLLIRIQTKDLKALSANRNVSEAIRRQAGRILVTRPH